MSAYDPASGFLKVLHSRLSLIAAASPPQGPEARALLPLWPALSPSQNVEAATLPACDHLAEALELGIKGPESDIAGGLLQLTPRLRWTYSYPRDARYSGLESQLAFTEVLGKTGIWPSQRMLLGFTLIAPHTHYPAHVHPAIELYLVIVGAAGWTLGGSSAEIRPPGSVIVHPSGAPHAMTTRAEPLLALFTWRGDLATSPSYV
jgi:mannose-6-phosphate isomerase-like protein (cupin superfamily)